MPKDSSETNSEEFLPLPEHLEITRQINELRLPISFQTNKESMVNGEERGDQKKNLYLLKETDNGILSSVTEIKGADASAAILCDRESNALCAFSLSSPIEKSYSDLEVEAKTKNFKLSFTVSGESSLPFDSFSGIRYVQKERPKSYVRYIVKSECQLEGATLKTSPTIVKYWHQRYELFSRFDEGIKMDEEGWFSVTPEQIAKHHAYRCAGGVIIDCFAGMGGNAIQFAKRCQRVIAIDIDPNKIAYARHNATVYGVEKLINFVNGDCMVVAPKFEADTVFLSPPWGGPNYNKVNVFDINFMLQPYSGCFLFQVAKAIAPKVVMFLPKNVNINQLIELALSTTPSCSLEVEKNYVKGKLKAITAYFDQPTE